MVFPISFIYCKTLSQQNITNNEGSLEIIPTTEHTIFSKIEALSKVEMKSEINESNLDIKKDDIIPYSPLSRASSNSSAILESLASSEQLLAEMSSYLEDTVSTKKVSPFPSPDKVGIAPSSDKKSRTYVRKSVMSEEEKKALKKSSPVKLSPPRGSLEQITTLDSSKEVEIKSEINHSISAINMDEITPISPTDMLDPSTATSMPTYTLFADDGQIISTLTPTEPSEVIQASTSISSNTIDTFITRSTHTSEEMSYSAIAPISSVSPKLSPVPTILPIDVRESVLETSTPISLATEQTMSRIIPTPTIPHEILPVSTSLSSSTTISMPSPAEEQITSDIVLASSIPAETLHTSSSVMTNVLKSPPLRSFPTSVEHEQITPTEMSTSAIDSKKLQDPLPTESKLNSSIESKTRLQ